MEGMPTKRSDAVSKSRSKKGGGGGGFGCCSNPRATASALPLPPESGKADAATVNTGSTSQAALTDAEKQGGLPHPGANGSIDLRSPTQRGRPLPPSPPRPLPLEAASVLQKAEPAVDARWAIGTHTACPGTFHHILVQKLSSRIIVIASAACSHIIIRAVLW